MHTDHRHDNDSRRQTQRRFPPGSFIIDSRGSRMAFVVGWGPTPVLERARRPWDPWCDEKVVTPRSWIAYVVEADRVLTLPWENVRDSYNLDEWEEG